MKEHQCVVKIMTAEHQWCMRLLLCKCMFGTGQRTHLIWLTILRQVPLNILSTSFVGAAGLSLRHTKYSCGSRTHPIFQMRMHAHPYVHDSSPRPCRAATYRLQYCITYAYM